MANNKIDISLHIDDIADAVHKVLKKKGVTGVRLTQMHFRADSLSGGGQCPPGFTWECVDVPPSGTKCRCVKDPG